MGEKENQRFELSFNASLRVGFQGNTALNATLGN